MGRGVVLGGRGCGYWCEAMKGVWMMEEGVALGGEMGVWNR